MFAFEAALREARAELAVVPDSVTATGTTHQQLAKLARTCLLHIDTVLSRGPKTKAKVAYEWLNTPAPATQPAGRGTAQPPASGDKGHHPPLAT